MITIRIIIVIIMIVIIMIINNNNNNTNNKYYPLKNMISQGVKRIQSEIKKLYSYCPWVNRNLIQLSSQLHNTLNTNLIQVSSQSHDTYINSSNIQTKSVLQYVIEVKKYLEYRYYHIHRNNII